MEGHEIPQRNGRCMDQTSATEGIKTWQKGEVIPSEDEISKEILMRDRSRNASTYSKIAVKAARRNETATKNPKRCKNPSKVKVSPKEIAKKDRLY